MQVRGWIVVAATVTAGCGAPGAATVARPVPPPAVASIPPPTVAAPQTTAAAPTTATSAVAPAVPPQIVVAPATRPPLPVRRPGRPPIPAPVPAVPHPAPAATTTTVPAACVVPERSAYSLAIAMTRPGTGFVSGTALQGTADGGQTWSRACLPAGYHGYVPALTFAPDGVHGWAAGGPDPGPFILRTEDAGATWNPVALPAGTRVADLAFPDATHGWAVGSNSGVPLVLSTTDGGRTWNTAVLPTGLGGAFNGASFVDPSSGWIHGATLEGTGVITSTADGGATWTTRPVPPGIDDVKDLAFADTATGWLVGSLVVERNPGPVVSVGVALATSDGGVTWGERFRGPPDSGSAFWSVDLTGPSSVFVGGAIRRAGLWASHDAGTTWEQRPGLSALSALTSVSFVDALHGWVTHSMFGIICMTGDGGRTWTGRSIDGVARDCNTPF